TTTGTRRPGPGRSSSSVSSSSSASPPDSLRDPARDSAAIENQVPPRTEAHVESAPGTEAPSPQTQASAPEVLAVDALDAYFGAARVVRDVSFTVQRGQVTATLGPQGRGNAN